MNSTSAIIYGASYANREEKISELIKKLDKNLLKKDHPDLFTIEKKKDKNSIGIEEAKKLISFFITKPYSSKYKVAVIYDSHAMTLQAQNALLKTLEEPPNYAAIFLETKSENLLIETIQSRCKKYEVRSEIFTKNEKYNLNEIRKMNIEEKFNLAEDLSKKEKEQVITILENFIMQERENLLKKADNASLANIELLIKISKDLSFTNINTRLALEYFLVNLI